MITQEAPEPNDLHEIVENLEYKQGYTFQLRDIDRGQGSKGLTLVVVVEGRDAYNPSEMRPVGHYFPVPPAAYNYATWSRWVLDCILKIELHEACEYMKIGDVRPFTPLHGPGNDPYQVFDPASEIDRRTNFRGEVNPAT